MCKKDCWGRRWNGGCAAVFVSLALLIIALPGFAGQKSSRQQVMHAGSSLRSLIEGDWADRDLQFIVEASEAKGEAFSLAHTRVVIARGYALARRLTVPANTRQVARLEQELRQIEKRLDASEPRRLSAGMRRDIHFEARWLVRAIAFSNPLLDFDAILFAKRHDSRGVFHMCDQYYGFNAVPGGGLFVLSDPFGQRPQLRNLLERSLVGNGRLAGLPLAPGAFVSPELSYDGKTILFAYTQAKGKDLEWTEESCYHVFKVDVDGGNLTQLTDGPWDDFDPCFLPDGRIVFVSERRGGYLRCGRHCPTYTMHVMDGDGGSLSRLSSHETHEWHPSVNNDGMIVYTRWDYVDRDTNIAHHLWTCFPDGRDPRSSHGNYPAARQNRPWMEMSIRAIPGSHKYVATAAAHHGHAFGSLVMIDPRIEDDGAMSQLTRLTPEAPFPEAEKNLKPIKEAMAYGTPWPLSEDDYLCVYDANAKNRGIYWIDRFGNKELLYRDPAISCLSPIPLQPRKKPPELPSLTAQTDETDIAQTGTIAIMSVYDSDFDWPPGTRITALRVIQVLPKTTPPPNKPRIGVASQTNARAVLGTVPVEADGSAYFTAPAGKQLYFQALDASGMAVQSMRSGTYLQPGENMTCLGCHEPKHRAPSKATKTPTALLRAPSSIQPDADGSNPFNYVRLVQPVLDQNCVACHEREGALDLSGDIEGEHGWTRSYANLADRYGFYFHVKNGSINDGVHGGSRSIAGAFGAKASPLLAYLDESHHGMQLPQEDFHRLTLWLDCNSEFYGSYENTAAQARGEIVFPTLD